MRRLRSVQWFSVRCALRACVTEALRALDSGGSARAVPATRRLLASRPAYRRFPSWQVPCIEIKGSVSQGSTWHETCVSRTTHPSTRVRFTAHIRAPRGVQPRRHRTLVQRSRQTLGSAPNTQKQASLADSPYGKVLCENRLVGAWNCTGIRKRKKGRLYKTFPDPRAKTCTTAFFPVCTLLHRLTS